MEWGDEVTGERTTQKSSLLNAWTAILSVLSVQFRGENREHNALKALRDQT